MTFTQNWRKIGAAGVMLRLRDCAAMYMSRFLLGALLLHGAAAHTNMVGILSAVDTLNFPSYPQCAMALYSCPSTSAAASSCDTLTYGRDGTDGDSTNVFRAVANVDNIVWPEDVGNSDVATGSRTAADIDGVANPDSLVSDSGVISDEADTDTRRRHSRAAAREAHHTSTARSAAALSAAALDAPLPTAALGTADTSTASSANHSPQLPYSVSRAMAKPKTQWPKSSAAMPFVDPAESRWCRSWIS